MVLRPIYILMLIVIPLISFALFWFIFQKGVVQNLPIAVYDQDQTSTSRQIKRMLDATSSLNISAEVSNFEEGKRLMLRDECKALVIIPRNLEKDVLSGLSPSIINYYNNEYLVVGSSISRSIETVVTTVSKTLNASVRLKKGEMAAEAMSHIEPVQTIAHTLFNPYLNYFYFFVGTLQPAMLQIFITVMTIFSVGSELKDGTAASLLDASNDSIVAALFGKLLPYTLIYTLIGVFMNVILFTFFKMPARGSLGLIILATFIFVLAYQALGLFFVALTANLRRSLSMASFYCAPAFAFAGVTFPLIGMPAIARVWGYMLPLTHYVRIFIDQAIKDAPLSVSLPEVGIMTCFLLVGPASVPRLHTYMKNSRHWGKL